MKHLTLTQRNALARQLDTLRHQVLEELMSRTPDTFAQAGLNESREVLEHKDQAEAEREDDVLQAEIEVDRHRLHDIEQAQLRLAEGRYGICIDCAAEIPAPRLLAQPTAIRCTECQAQAEAGRLRG